MSLEIFLFLNFILINIIILCNLRKLSYIFNLIDYSVGKIHSKDTPKFGFFLFFFILLFNFIIFLADYQNNFIFILLFFFCFLIIGYLDDRYEINVFIRVVLSLIVSVTFYYYNPNNYFVSNFFHPFINLFLLCFFTLGFLHLVNISDGMNGFVPSLFLYSLFYYYFKGYDFLEYNYQILLIFLIIGVSLYLIPNFLGFCFLGNTGSYLISISIAIIFMELYKREILEYSDILLIFFIPLLDGLRVTIKRIIDKKNPFKGDFTHMHHLIRGKFFKIILFFILVFWPSLINFFYKDFTIYISIIAIILYIIFYKLNYKSNIDKLDD